MPLPSSGPISMGNMNTEKNISENTPNTYLSVLISGFNINKIDNYAFSDFYGKSYGVYYFYYLSYPYDDFASACNDPVEDPSYSVYTKINIQNYTDIDVDNTIFYTDQIFSSTYNGNNKWYKLITNNSFSVLIDSNGLATGVIPCS